MAGNKLYVGNLPYDTTSDQLNELFAGFGTVKETTVISSKGFGFVEFSSSEEAENAKTGLNGKDFRGRALKIDEAKPQRDRTSGRSRERY